jgi:hypothetical protein
MLVAAFLAGSGGGLSPNLAALLSANPLNRDGSMDWMAWPPSPPTAPTATGTANIPEMDGGQTQPPHMHNRESQLHQAASAAPLDLDGAPSVNHWLPGSLPDPLADRDPAAAAAAAAGSAVARAGWVARQGPVSGAPWGATSPLLQGQDQLQLHQIHIGGEPLFHAAMTAPHSLPYSTGLGAGGETKMSETLSAGWCRCSFEVQHCVACILFQTSWPSWRLTMHIEATCSWSCCWSSLIALIRRSVQQCI